MLNLQKSVLVGLFVLTSTLLLIPIYNSADAAIIANPRGGGGGRILTGPPTRVPASYVVTSDTSVHYYQLTDSNLVDLGKEIVLTGGYVLGTAATISAAVSTGLTAAPGAAAAIAAGTDAYYNTIKKLHGQGARGDDILYPGKRMQGNDGKPCTISSININLLNHNYNVINTGKVTQAPGPVPFTSFGASLVTYHEGTSDPSVLVHWYYDIGSAVRYNVAYTVDRPGCAIVG